MIKKIFLYFILTNNYLACAQDGGSEHVLKYFQDGGISEAKNILKFNVFSAISGDYTIAYERLLNDRLGIDAGLGYVSSKFIDMLPQTFNGDHIIQSRGAGYSFFFQVKFYINEQIEGWNQSIKFTNRNFSIEESDINQQLITVHSGYQFIIQNRIILNLSAGIGFMNSNFSEESNVEVIIPLGFVVGYLF